jgi:WD40 repeat protein
MRLWEVASGREVRRFDHDREVHAVAFSADGKRALSGCWDLMLRLWDVETGQVRLIAGHATALMSVALSPDGQWALSSADGPDIWLWNLADGKVRRTFHGHTMRVQHVTFSRDGTRVLSASHDSTMRLWDANTGQELRRFRGSAAPLGEENSHISAKAFTTADAGFDKAYEELSKKLKGGDLPADAVQIVRASVVEYGKATKEMSETMAAVFPK